MIIAAPHLWRVDVSVGVNPDDTGVRAAREGAGHCSKADAVVATKRHDKVALLCGQCKEGGTCWREEAQKRQSEKMSNSFARPSPTCALACCFPDFAARLGHGVGIPAVAKTFVLCRVESIV